MTVNVAGTSLHLLPERAAYWAPGETLFVADTHWGKAAAFRSHSIAVPHGTTSGDLARLTSLIGQTQCRRIVLLGDAIHAKEGRGALDEVAVWRAMHRDVQILLIRGNHDRRAGDPPEELRIDCLNAPLAEAPFVFQHHPLASPEGYALAGHIHPAISLHGRGLQRATLPCFWFTRDYCVLPAFGSFCGRALIEPAPEDRIYAIAGDEIVQVS